MINPNQRIAQYTAMHGIKPPANWLATSCKITIEAAEKLLSQKDLFDEPKTNENIHPFEAKKTFIPAINFVHSAYIEPVTKVILETDRVEPVANVDQCEPVELIDELKGIDKIIITFTNAIKSFVFLFSSIADMALACFFYFSLGFDPLSKIVLGIWGAVLTSGKIWAWSERKKHNCIMGSCIIYCRHCLDIFSRY